LASRLRFRFQTKMKTTRAMSSASAPTMIPISTPVERTPSPLLFGATGGVYGEGGLGGGGATMMVIVRCWAVT